MIFFGHGSFSLQGTKMISWSGQIGIQSQHKIKYLNVGKITSCPLL